MLTTKKKPAGPRRSSARILSATIRHFACTSAQSCASHAGASKRALMIKRSQRTRDFEDWPEDEDCPDEEGWL
jgi:hypothetical protein